MYRHINLTRGREERDDAKQENECVTIEALRFDVEEVIRMLHGGEGVAGTWDETACQQGRRGTTPRKRLDGATTRWRDRESESGHMREEKEGGRDG